MTSIVKEGTRERKGDNARGEFDEEDMTVRLSFVSYDLFCVFFFICAQKTGLERKKREPTTTRRRTERGGERDR